MHIAFRISSMGFGGAERVFLSLADHMKLSYDCEIDFVVDSIANHETEDIVRNKGFRLIGLTVDRTWKSIIPFSRYLEDFKPDVVISAYTETNGAALISKLFSYHKPIIIVTEHASLNEHWARKKIVRRWILEFIVRFVYRLANQVLGVSQGLAKQLARRLGATRVSYLHNPVRLFDRAFTIDQAKKKLGRSSDRQIILAVGRISIPKNYLLLLQAITGLKNQKSVEVLIVGGIFDVEEKRRLDQYISDHELDGIVTFVDFTHDLQIYYASADIFVLTSAWEGFGNVIVEALSFGLPIVSTRCNFGPAEILEEGTYGKLVNVGDHKGMTQSIEEVLNNNPFNSSKQKDRANIFSEKTVGEKYFRLINDLVGVRK